MLQQLTIKNPRKVPVQNGWHWINEGVRYFIGNKLTWMLSMFFVLFFAVFLVPKKNQKIPISAICLSRFFF